MPPSFRKFPKVPLLCIILLCLIIYYYNNLTNSLRQRETKPSSSPSLGEERDDDPKLIEHLRKNVILPPPGRGKFTRLLFPDKREAHSELYPIVKGLVNNMTGGFFIECGANDGEFISNTLPFELNHGWTGLLIEADPKAAKILKGRGRNAWVAEGCLSPEKRAMQIEMLRWGDLTELSGILELHKNPGTGAAFMADCYPLSSLLLALNRTVVDYFSLDIEGAELPVLRTIPWDRIRINVLSVEVAASGLDKLKEYLEPQGMKYHQYVDIADKYIQDAFFVHENFKP